MICRRGSLLQGIDRPNFAQNLEIFMEVKYIDAATAVAHIQSGQRVFLHGSAATPELLVTALQSRSAELKDVELCSITTLGNVSFDQPDCRNSFFFNSLFVSAATRAVANSESGDYVPIFLSEIPQLFTATSSRSMPPSYRYLPGCSWIRKPGNLRRHCPGGGGYGEVRSGAGKPQHAAHPWRRVHPYQQDPRDGMA